MGFNNKDLQITVEMEMGGDLTFKDLACRATIRKPGLPEKNTAEVRIWGLRYENMANLTSLGFHPLELKKNRIVIQAGEEGGALPIAFQGEITMAWADFNTAPDPVMIIQASSGTLPQMSTPTEMFINGECEAAHLFRMFADEAGYTYSNRGVTNSIRNVWFSGSPIEKAMALAEQIGCNMVLDDDILYTLPVGQAITSGTGDAIVLNADNGLIGYPTFSQNGIACRCLYHPALRFGGLVQLESVVPKASGVWRITNLNHNLSARLPGGGAWETSLEATPL